MNDDFDNFHSTIRVGASEGRQLLFASQSYETNYFIYGMFQAENITEDSASLTGVSMLFVNYKGLLNLGFSSEESHAPKIIKIEEPGQDPIIEIQLCIRAEVSDKTIPQLDIQFDHPIEITGETNLRILRKLVPIAGDDTRQPIVNGVFDNEFYYRDGWEYARRVVRDINGETDCFEVYSLEDDITGPQTGPGIKCREAHFKIQYIK